MLIRLHIVQANLILSGCRVGYTTKPSPAGGGNGRFTLPRGPYSDANAVYHVHVYTLNHGGFVIELCCYASAYMKCFGETPLLAHVYTHH